MAGKHYKIKHLKEEKKNRSTPQAPPPPFQRERTAVNGFFLPEIL